MPQTEAQKLIHLEDQEAVLKKQREEYKKILKLIKEGKATEGDRLKIKEDIIKTDKEIKKTRSDINKEDKEGLGYSKISVDYATNLGIKYQKITKDKKLQAKYEKDVAVQQNLAVTYGKKSSLETGKNAKLSSPLDLKFCCKVDTPGEINVVTQSNPPSSLTVQVKFCTIPNTAS